MTPTPTLYLRFVEREEITRQEENCTVTKKVRVLQQFWSHPDGSDYAGDMFRAFSGNWRDVPLEKP